MAEKVFDFDKLEEVRRELESLEEELIIRIKLALYRLDSVDPGMKLHSFDISNHLTTVIEIVRVTPCEVFFKVRTRFTSWGLSLHKNWINDLDNEALRCREHLMSYMENEE